MKKLVFWMILFFVAANANAQNPPSQVDVELISRTAFGRSDDVKILLEQGADANVKNTNGQPVLNIAASRNDDDGLVMVKLLMANGANFDARDHYGDDALFATVSSGTVETLEYFLTYLPAMTRLDAQNKTLLERAEIRGNEEMVEVIELAEQGENIRLEGNKTEENFRRLLKEFSESACTEAYARFYLKVNDKEKEHDESYYNNMIVEEAAKRQNLFAQLNRFFDTEKKVYEEVVARSSDAIISQLLRYEKRFHRKVAKIGTEKDIKKRCDAVGTSISTRLRKRTIGR